MSSRFAWLAVVALMCVLSVGTAVAPASAHGTLDQMIAGNPACDSTSFKGFTSSGSALRQEFVPTQVGLGAVDLCLNLSATTTVSVNIRAGTEASPGAVLGTASRSFEAGFAWAHLDMSSAVDLTPGTKYVIELPVSASFQWRATCGAIGGSCAAVEADGYPAGSSTRGGTSNFGFRTYSIDPGAAPVGVADQALIGDPSCSEANFRGFTSSGGPTRQEFVPVQPGLAFVDLCVNNLNASSNVAINIRGGTANTPGTILDSGSTAMPALGFQWIRVAIDPVLALTPGTKFVIELTASPTFQWRATCGEVLGSCTSLDTDLYPLGSSTRTGASDFAFRTIAGVVDVGVPPVGTADQKLTGDPSCSETIFKGFTASATPIRQEFVPSQPGLAFVDLCINNLDITSNVVVNIRTGTATTPGATLDTGTIGATALGFQWVRVAIEPTLALTPGTKYVIELPASNSFQWRATCASVSGTCTSIDPDLYPAGTSTRGGTSDFAFRTIAGAVDLGDAPDGSADQSLAGDPACSATNFKAFSSSSGALRQEFLPSAGVRGVDAVDLCLNVISAPIAITLNIRTGTAAGPGPIIGTVTTNATATGFQFLRFDLTNATPTTPGLMYVVELPASNSFQWRGTCGSVLGTCLAVDPDLYTGGGTNTTAIRDFAFRTIAGTPVLRGLPQVASDKAN